MAKYLFTGSYTSDGAKGVLAEGGSRRAEVARGLISSLGGTVESFYFGFGGSDFYLVADLPGHSAAAAGALTTSASGAMHVSTTVLLTPDDIDEATQLSPQYRAPGA